MISTKGRYSIRILLDLAEHRNGGYIPMKEVAARQDISLKYIEKLMPALKAAGFIESVHGIGGGYRLAREPETYTLWDILLRSEGDLAPVSCLKDGAGACARAAQFSRFRQKKAVAKPPGVCYNQQVTVRRVSTSVVHRLPKPRRRVRFPYPAPKRKTPLRVSFFLEQHFCSAKVLACGRAI